MQIQHVTLCLQLSYGHSTQETCSCTGQVEGDLGLIPLLWEAKDDTLQWPGNLCCLGKLAHTLRCFGMNIRKSWHHTSPCQWYLRPLFHLPRACLGQQRFVRTDRPASSQTDVSGSACGSSAGSTTMRTKISIEVSHSCVLHPIPPFTNRGSQDLGIFIIQNNH